MSLHNFRRRPRLRLRNWSDESDKLCRKCGESPDHPNHVPPRRGTTVYAVGHGEDPELTSATITRATDLQITFDGWINGKRQWRLSGGDWEFFPTPEEAIAAREAALREHLRDAQTSLDEFLAWKAKALK